jgi:hypothetical protein
MMADLAKPIAQAKADTSLTDLKNNLKSLIYEIKTMVAQEVVPQTHNGKFDKFCDLLRWAAVLFERTLTAQSNLLSAFEDCARYRESLSGSEPESAVKHQKKQLESLQALVDIFPKVVPLAESAKPSYSDEPIYGRNLVDVQTFLQSAEDFLNAL